MRWPLVFFWQQNGNSLSESIDLANQYATQWNGSTQLPSKNWVLEADNEFPGEGGAIIFNPQTHLRKVGFGDLRFNGLNSFNHFNDWVHR
jgi:hypothetical protein